MSRMRIFVVSSVLVVLWTESRAADEFLDLYSSEGKLMQARVVKVDSGMAELVRKRDGRRFTVAIDRFDEDSQKTLREIGENGVPPGAGLFDSVAGSGDVNKRIYPRSKAEIKEAMASIKSQADGQPSFSRHEQEACYNLNVYRYLAGLSYDTKLDRGLCEAAVIAATGCEEIGKLDHGVNPEAGKCNLSGGGSIAKSIHGYMNDSGASNREHRAHRAWCLSPTLGKLGIGTGKAGRFSAMWTMDKSANSRIKADFFAYPSPGYFPVSFLNGKTAWTVYFPGAQMPDKKDLEVKVYKLSKVPEKPFRPGDIPEGGREVDLSYVSLSKWVTPCVNFEPAADVDSGKRYWVSIVGGDFEAAFMVEFMRG